MIAIKASVLPHHDTDCDYQDRVQRYLSADEVPNITANNMLALVLQGCVQAHPWQVQVAMCVRNVLVKPWRLRTSTIGCPVSSLLDAEATVHFLGAYPVREILRDDATHAEVVLGADDRHLGFRTSIAVECLKDGGMRISMTTRVKTRNRFGWIYMSIVDPVHRRWIAPAILDAALNYACSANAKAVKSFSATDIQRCATR